ncbi:MAG: ABC transporter permease subunit [Thermoplasmata archaeon]|nr:MAG: ABC transporter permease subunit [Thermoplasmata archaeon]
MDKVGVTPIEYRPWDGKRTDYYRRFLVISRNVLRQKLKSKWILALLIIGVILVHVFSIIFLTVIPHEGLTPQMMVGEDPEETEESGAPKEPITVNGKFQLLGSMELNGYMELQGSVFGVGTVKGNGSPVSSTMVTDNGFVLIIGTLVLDGELELSGGLNGVGYFDGNFTISGDGDVQIQDPINLVGAFELNGTVRVGGHLDINGSVSGTGSLFGNGTPISNSIITDNGEVLITDTIVLNGEMQISGSITGSGNLDGNYTILILGTSAKESAEEQTINERWGGYLNDGLLVIFTILLASLVCSDLIAEDLGDNSFILYFSRPIKTIDYLAGKILGALWVLGLFCFLPLIIFCIAVMGTQSGSDYGTSLNVLGSTFIAGLLTTFIFVPYGILISSFTKRKSYATIGIFMSFFVLIIIGNIFAGFDRNWVLLDPTRVLYYSYDILYGFSIPEGINGTLHGVVLLCILVIPLVVLYLRIHLKGVGK